VKIIGIIVSSCSSSSGVIERNSQSWTRWTWNSRNF